jgi:hypothetical protein
VAGVTSQQILERRMKLETDNDQLMVTAAHRYCLGRSSYIVGSCIEWLNDIWYQLSPNSKFVILRDTIEAIVQHRAGHASDERDWRRFVISRDITESQRTQLMGALKYMPAAVEFIGHMETTECTGIDK